MKKRELKKLLRLALGETIQLKLERDEMTTLYNGTIAGIAESASNHKVDLASAGRQRDADNKQNEELRAQARELQDRLDAAEGSLAGCNRTAEMTTAAFVLERDNLREKLTELQADVTGPESYKRKHDEEKARHAEELKTARGEIAHLELKVRAAGTEIADYESTTRDLRAGIRERDLTITRLNASLAEVNAIGRS